MLGARAYDILFSILHHRSNHASCANPVSPTHDNYGSATILSKHHARDFAYQALPVFCI